VTVLSNPDIDDPCLSEASQQTFTKIHGLTSQNTLHFSIVVCCILEHLPCTIGTVCVWINVSQGFHVDCQWMDISNTDDT